MAESKMATMAATRRFCNGSFSEHVQGPKLYKCHTFMIKWTFFSGLFKKILDFKSLISDTAINPDAI